MTDTPLLPSSYHLADFETTTAGLLGSTEALALLNFAALFHEVVYLPDTVLGDHRLILDSFAADRHRGLFRQVSGLIENGVIHVLFRDRVVVRDRILTQHEPTLNDIYEGWLHRDRTEWDGESGLTVRPSEKARRAYYREIDALIFERCPSVVHRYDPDLPKQAFRRRILEQIDKDSGTFAAQYRALPQEFMRRLSSVTEDARFTNAELWRILRDIPSAHELLILNAHINQQCYADLTGSSLAAHQRGGISLASFNTTLSDSMIRTW
jgi:hypothetical protein